MKNILILASVIFLSLPLVAQEPPKSRGNTFNPDIGLNTLFRYRNSSQGNDPTSGYRNGFALEEAELQFSSDVDPYFRAVGLFAIREDAGWKIKPEEVYGETLGLSLLTIKFGKFKALVNKHNLLHSHAFPFVDEPVVNTKVMGEGGLNETGVSVAVLVPTNWFMELTLQVLNGDSTQLFGSPSPNDNGGVAYLDNLFDLSDDLTLQLGGSFTQGQNTTDGITRIGGGDLSVKWKPVASDSIRTLKWANNFLYADLDQNPSPKAIKQGFASYLQWQGGLRWWLQARTEYYTRQDLNPFTEIIRKNSALYAFTPSEFSAIRFQVDQIENSTQPIDRRFVVQFNLSIGAHPAHQY